MTNAIVNIGQLVTLTGSPRPRVGKELHDLGIITNGALIIEDGRIAAVGTPRNSRRRFRHKQCSCRRSSCSFAIERPNL